MSKFLIRYGEIALKSKPVRERMEKRLAANIRAAFQDQNIKARVTRSFGRFFIETTEPKPVKAVLERIFGIVSFSLCFSCPSEMMKITALALETARKKKFRSFAVDTRRVGDHKFSSKDVNIQVGDVIREKLKKKVDLSSPDLTVWIEVRDKNTYIYTEKIPGQGGFPLGVQKNAIALIKTREDLLAAWLFLRKGCEILPVTSNKKFLKILEKWTFYPLEAVSLEKALAQAHAIVSGKDEEALRKKHSLPVYNPLLGLDKKEIASLMKKIT